MSNYDNDDRRYDPRMRNGWAEYQRLVLTELERHNNLIEQLNLKLNDVSLQIALMKQESTKIAKLEQRADEGEKRLDKLDEGNLIENAIHKYRAWLLSGGFLLLSAIVVPLIRLFFGG